MKLFKISLNASQFLFTSVLIGISVFGYANFCEAQSANIYTKVTAGDIVNDGADSRGVSWGDYDNDKDLDLFISNNKQKNHLYQNNGNGTFTKITSGDIVNDIGWAQGSSWGDYDNDGNLDLFVANAGNVNNFLYKNDGDGTFTRNLTVPFVTDGGDSYGGLWGDYDNDGDLDIYINNYNNQNNRYYENNGDGTFTQVTSGSFVNDGGQTFTSNIADYDNDGDLDIFVVNNFGQNNALYQNNGDATFNKITTGDVVGDGGYSIGASWGDYDNDGYLDLFVTNSNNGTGNENNVLYHNNGDGSFSKITEGDIVNDASDSKNGIWGDVNNDGYLDLFVTNFGTNLLYLNNGNMTFTKVTDGDIVSDSGEFLTGSFADYDNDGSLDLFVANRSNLNNLLYNNIGNDNNWINVECIGTVSNNSAIGAKIKVRTTIDGSPVRQVRMIAEHSHRSQNSFNAEFGLGDAATIDSLIVEWPSGLSQTLTNVQVNQFLEIIEPQSCEPTICSGAAVYPSNGNGELGETITGAPGTQIQIAINMKENPNKVDAFNFRVNFDDTQLEFLSGDKGGLTSAFPFLSAQLNAGDSQQIICGGLHTTPIPENSTGSLIVLNFKIIAQEDMLSNIEISNLLNDLSGFSACCVKFQSNSSLPVELVSFLARVSDRQVSLSWVTVSETNNFGFDVEKSIDGEVFDKIAFVPGSGTTVQPQQYFFIDNKSLNSRVFYRLKQVDTDGSFEYSKILEVNVNLPQSNTLAQNYPNPFNPTTNIYYELSEPMDVKLEIFNLRGQSVVTLVDAFQHGGYYDMTWNGLDQAKNQVGAGIYFMRLSTRSLKGESKYFSRTMVLIE